MKDSDRGEGLERTDNVILLWHNLYPPCLEELSLELGFKVGEGDVIYGPRATAPNEDAVEHYVASTEQIIEREGIPRVIVVCDIFTPETTVETPGKAKPPVRTKYEVIAALVSLADKYGTKFVGIDPQKIIEIR